MSRHIALVHPTGLLAVELRETLDRQRDLWRRLDLLSDLPDDVGTLGEVGGKPVLVQPIDEHSFEGTDVVFFAGDIEAARPLIARVPAETTIVLLSPGAGPEDGHPVVAGINLETAEPERVLLSPHPGTVALAHLLHPLLQFRPRRLAATLLQPVSIRGKAALDEMFDQTRAILAFADNPPREIFPTQLAFNVLPAESPGHVAGHLRTVLGLEAPMSVQVLQAAIFHSFAVSLHLELAEDPGVEAVKKALEGEPFIDFAVDPELLGPIDAANRDEVLVGSVDPVAGLPGVYQLWAVMDNLTRGGALNALAILEALHPVATH